MSFLKATGKQLIKPYTALWRSGVNLKNTAADGFRLVSGTAKAIHKVQPSSDPDMAAARKINDNKERFEFLYRQKNWSPKELEQQKRAIRRSQAVSSLFVLVAVFAMMWSTTTVASGGSIFIAFGSFTLSFLAAAVMAGNTLKFAIFVAQLDERELLTSKDFMNRDDFWRRILLPFAAPKKVKAG